MTIRKRYLQQAITLKEAAISFQYFYYDFAALAFLSRDVES